MKCLKPRSVGFKADGTSLAWRFRDASKEYPVFKLPCGKCIECRLEYARSWAVRCVHESKMHERNCFITLTYSDEHLASPKLVYADFQLFMKRLRSEVFEKFIKNFGLENWKILDKKEKKEIYGRLEIGYFVTGEYGEKNKRPHWHAILFNWEPDDLVFYRSNENGDKLYTSRSLDRLWGKNDPDSRPNEVGGVSFESAGYVARYAAKKLVHGPDGHGYEPVSKKSKKNAIGKKFVERFWLDMFSRGEVILDNGRSVSIPRYYLKWLEKNKPEEWERYVTSVKSDRDFRARVRFNKMDNNWIKVDNLRRADGKGLAIKPDEVREKITNGRFKRLQKYLIGKD